MQSCWSLFGISLFVCLVASPPVQAQRPDTSSGKSNGSDLKKLQAHNRAAATEAAKLHSPSGTTSNARSTTAAPVSALGTVSQPASFFDAAASHFASVVSTVQVHDLPQPETAESFHAGGQEIISVAGAFGDISRFLQEFPGVQARSDLTDDLFVRGGDPMENLFVVDGIQVPNINSLALLGTTGGFGPMIDSAAIQSVNLFAGDHDAQYPERLSSIIEIQMLEPRGAASHAELDLGIQGIGGLAEIPLHGSGLLFSAHHGLLSIMNQFGISGLPSYTNELIRFRKMDTRGNRLTLLHLGGWDSIRIVPCPGNGAVSSTIESQYSGQRETTGLEWQQMYSKDAFGVANISDSEQLDQVDQQDELFNPVNVPPLSHTCVFLPSAPAPQLVYRERANGAFSTAGYRFEWSRPRFTATAGSAFWLQRPNYKIDQPAGAYSPYSAVFSRADSTSFSSHPSIGESGTYFELTARLLKPLEFTLGGRFQSFAFGDHNTLTPRISLRYRFGEYLSAHAALATYAQMPPYVYLLSFPQNRSLLPMRATDEVVGIDIGPLLSSQIRVEAYEKEYRDVPTSTEYPTVNLHDQVDDLGQQFVWLPMNSGGHGRAAGIDLSDTTRIGSGFLARASVAYSRARFAALDRVMRPGNVDVPWVVNIAALQRLGRGYEISSRFAFASGRPYTPLDLPDSLAQNRAIYDTTQMNSLRAPYYARFDAQLNKDVLLRGFHLELYLGVNNILNRSNFLTYLWLPRAGGSDPSRRVYEMDQMPIFPNVGIRYMFR